MNNLTFTELFTVLDYAVQQENFFENELNNSFQMLGMSEEQEEKVEKRYSENKKELEDWQQLTEKLRRKVKQRIVDFANE